MRHLVNNSAAVVIDSGPVGSGADNGQQQQQTGQRYYDVRRSTDVIVSVGVNRWRLFDVGQLTKSSTIDPCRFDVNNAPSCDQM